METTEAALREWLTALLARTLGLAPEEVALDRSLDDYGLDSIDAVLIGGELEEKFGVEIDPAAFLRFATFEEMVVGLAHDHDAAAPSQTP